MTDFPPLPAEWVLDASRNPPVYTRPLVGSELLMQRQWKAFDACGEVCIGINFTATISVEVLKSRTLDALDKLRFLCPLIACTIEDVVSDDGVSPHWVYAPPTDRKAWLNLSFCIEDRGASLDIPQFMNSINTKRLPYTDESGIASIFRAYLLTTSKRHDDGKLECGLYFHGSHSILDGGPALNAFNLMCEWISGKGIDVSVVHSEEWKNLPVDPITATGGFCEEWETSGVELLQEVAEKLTRPIPCHSIPPPSGSLSHPNPSFHYAITVSQPQTAAIIARTKELGISLPALFQAAHCLAQFNMNPITKGMEVDFSSDMALVNIERYMKASINPKTHLVSFHTVTPTRFSMTQLLIERSERARLVTTAKAFQECVERHLSHPCLAQLSVVLANFPEAEERQTATNPWRCAFTNLDVVEKRLKTEHGEIRVENVCAGNRPGRCMTAYMWTIHASLYFQVHGSSAWGEDVMKRLLDETVRIGFLILDDAELSTSEQPQPGLRVITKL